MNLYFKDAKKCNDCDKHIYYYDTKIIESDIRRTKFLEENGWDVIRIRWSDYLKLSNEKKKLFIIDLKNYINQLISIKPLIYFEDKNKCSWIDIFNIKCH